MGRSSVFLLAGLLFGLGLVLAGMEQPAVILGAFDLSAQWDARILLLFVGANLVHGLASAWLRRRGRTLRGVPLTSVIRKVDRPLVAGSLIFGVGWGLAGVCPGPGIVAALTGASHNLVFLAAFAAGIALHTRLNT